MRTPVRPEQTAAPSARLAETWIAPGVAKSERAGSDHHLLSRLSATPTIFTIYQNLVSLNYRAIKRRLREFLVPGVTHLDVGCGTGNLYLFVIRHGGAYVGFDVDEAAIAYARRRYAEADFRVLDAREVPIVLGQYERIFSVGVLHHLGDAELDATMRAMRDLVAPGGRYLVIDAVPAASRWNLIGRFLRALDNGSDIRGAAAYRSIIERHFRVLDERVFGQFPLDYVAFELEPVR